MNDIAEKLSALMDRVGVRYEDAARKAVLDMASQMILMSPVDTGRFRANWIADTKLNTTTTESTENSLGAVQASIKAWDMVGSMWVCNSLPYARRLEEGWSKQAPAGMVGLTVQRYGAYLDEALRAAR